MSDQTFAFSLRFSRTQFCLAFFSGVFNSLPVGKVLSEARRRDKTIKKSLTFLDEKKIQLNQSLSIRSGSLDVQFSDKNDFFFSFC